MKINYRKLYKTERAKIKAFARRWALWNSKQISEGDFILSITSFRDGIFGEECQQAWEKLVRQMDFDRKMAEIKARGVSPLEILFV